MISGGPTVAALSGTLDGAIDRLALCDLRAGIPFEAEGGDGLTFHYVLAGTICVEVAGGAAMVVPAGSALLLPAGQSIRIDCDAAGVSAGGPRARAPDARLMIGGVSPRAATSLGIGAIFDPRIHDASPAPGAPEILAALLAEIDQPLLGTIPLASALMKLCLIHAARDIAEGAPATSSRVGRAVSAVLRDPGAPHSIASLADLVRMSRATFIRHFGRLTGSNPIQFVSDARMDHAAELLRSTDLPIKGVAAQIGFANRSHFSRAFRRKHGIDPSTFRKGTPRQAAASQDISSSNTEP